MLGDLFELENILLGRAEVNEFTLNSLLDLELIASVDLPMTSSSVETYELYGSDFVPRVNNTLSDNAPIACVLDSGVYSGHKLLSSLIAAENDFDVTENTTTDLNGHGTGIAGIVAYGDFTDFDRENKIFTPLVKICNGKVMHNDDRRNPAYSVDERPEIIIEKAVRYFYDTYNCRIFNLSSGDTDRVYDGGRQMPWAYSLDLLQKELDIVIVVSAGNVSYPEIPDVGTRSELCEKIRDNLLTPKHRLLDPATTALGITVGAITRYAAPESPSSSGTAPVSVGNENYPSVFTRTGFGVNKAVKPEFADYGGNFCLTQMPRGNNHTRWQPNNKALLEPTLNNTTEKAFKGYVGTNFAAPHVTHITARIEKSLEKQMGHRPSANLIRAVLANSAKYTQEEWLEGSNEPNFTGEKRKIQEWKMRLSGYGKVDDSTISSTFNNITLFAEDELTLRDLDLYKIPIPPEFLTVKANKRITISFAYNPPIRLSRQAYISNSLHFEVFKDTDEEELLKYKAKSAEHKDEEADEIMKKYTEKHSAQKFTPGSTTLNKSTLQQRMYENTAKGGKDLLNEQNPYLYVLVTGKEKFAHPDEKSPQPYAIAITYSYDGDTDILLRQKLLEQANVKIKDRIKTPIQLKL
ncbi:serine protease [Clostridia bacterium]|nr:serine protease [Clostridia bacterium]